MSDITCTETATLLSEVSPLGCRSPWEREMAKIALLNRIADGAGTAAANAASFGTLRSVTTSTTIVSTDFTILADAASGSIIVSLPPAATANGRIFCVIRTNSGGANNVTVDPYASETINGAANHVLTSQYSRVVFTSNGTAWFLIVNQ